MATWQFVEDMASASPTVNLDLNLRPLLVADGYNFDPPKFNKGYASSPLRHGARQTNSVAENRVIALPIQFLATSTDSAALYAEALARQISRNNILKYQASSATAPVFFRTFADPDVANDLKKTFVQQMRVTLQLEAEPFAYGVRESLGTFTVTNNPVSDGCTFDITGSSIKGDSPTPLLMVSTSTGASGAPSGLVNKWVHIGSRRRGQPTFLDYVIQGEAMTQGTNATVTADATMSNGSKSRISFGTATEVLRLSETFPESGVSGVAARGEYIVYARVAKTTPGDTITCRIGYGASSTSPVMNDVVTLPAGAGGPYWVNLGKLPVPPWSDPRTIGPTGVDAAVLLPFFGFYAARTAGSGNLDVDCFFFMPADDQTLIVKFPSTDTTYAIDGTTNEGGAVYGVNTSLTDVITTQTPPQITGGGGFPEAIPGQGNRFFMLRQVDPTGTVDALTNTTTFQIYYWPRWREPFRP